MNTNVKMRDKYTAQVEFIQSQVSSMCDDNYNGAMDAIFTEADRADQKLWNRYDVKQDILITSARSLNLLNDKGELVSKVPSDQDESFKVPPSDYRFSEYSTRMKRTDVLSLATRVAQMTSLIDYLIPLWDRTTQSHSRPDHRDVKRIMEDLGTLFYLGLQKSEVDLKRHFLFHSSVWSELNRAYERAQQSGDEAHEQKINYRIRQVAKQPDPLYSIKGDILWVKPVTHLEWQDIIQSIIDQLIDNPQSVIQ